MINQCDLEEILKDLPSEWREALIKILLEIQNDVQSVNCEQVKACETVTKLSEFTVNGSEVCITFTDEHGVEVTRCFSLEEIFNEIIGEVDPGCITTPTTWNTMSIVEKFQALVDTVCNCCPETTTTTTSSTTTTTTTP